jgi:cardiolipin synthase
VRTAAFLPLRLRRRITLNFRNHRKIVVVDGHDAYTGGLNVGDAYREQWHDVGLRLRGPVVEQLQRVFADDWLFATGEDLALPTYFGAARPVRRASADLPEGEDPDAACAVVASGPDQRYNLTHDSFVMAINEATERIWLTTPYLIPGPTLLTALRCAVYRGVDVRLIVPARNDVWVAKMAARSYYPDLLESGIRLFEYEPSVLHAKVLIFDRGLSVLGSANLDTRSFQSNFEVSCFISSRAANQALAELFERDLARSHEVQREDVSLDHVWERLVEAAAHLLSPLL